MNTLDDWPRVKRVLEGALACEDSERQAYLAEACGADAVLRARIDRLLACRRSCRDLPGDPGRVDARATRP